MLAQRGEPPKEFDVFDLWLRGIFLLLLLLLEIKLRFLWGAFQHNEFQNSKNLRFPADIFLVLLTTETENSGIFTKECFDIWSKVCSQLSWGCKQLGCVCVFPLHSSKGSLQ